MHPFTVTHPDSVTASITADIKDAKFIAGGTNLVDLMKLDIETPSLLIDIQKLPLKEIERMPDDGLRIGALVTNSALAYDPIVTEKFSLIRQAILAGASPQLRNVATTGGNILQRTRCPYFYDIEFGCNKRHPGTGCSAIGGYDRSHAIMGVSDHCIATHPSDLCVALAALEAMVHVQGPAGKRTIPFGDFHKVPGMTPEVEHDLRKGELITHITLPAPSFQRSVYIKVRDRASYEFAIVSAAIAVEINGDMIRRARIAFGGIGTKPWRSTEAEKMLAGKAPGDDLFGSAAELALQGAKPGTHNAFKIDLAKRTLIRALTKVTAK
jgi:xanthine dehydrogenase YagS FAD-binding subunit